jgi:membrane protease subunit HflC
MRHQNKGSSRARRLVLPALAAIGALAVVLCFFRVETGEYAVVTEFGDPVQVVTDPGLGIKYPYQSVRKFDARLYVHIPAFSEFLTLDKTAVIASGVVLWRVEDPRKYFETVFNRAGAESRLSDILFAELGAAIGRNPLSAFVGIDQAAYRADEILTDVARRSRDTARRDYGIDVVDVKLHRFDFPERNRLRVYARMKSERAQISMKYRSEGEEEGLKIRAEADGERVRIRSEAFKVAEQHRGQGEAEAARIYAGTLEAAPHFYRFLRTLEASRKFVEEGTTLVLPANSELFGLLYDSKHYERASDTTPQDTPATGDSPERESLNR